MPRRTRSHIQQQKKLRDDEKAAFKEAERFGRMQGPWDQFVRDKETEWITHTPNDLQLRDQQAESKDNQDGRRWLQDYKNAQHKQANYLHERRRENVMTLRRQKRKPRRWYHRLFSWMFGQNQ